MMFKYLLIAALLSGCTVDFGKKETNVTKAQAPVPAEPDGDDDFEDVPVEDPPIVTPTPPEDIPEEDPDGGAKKYFIDIWWSLYHPQAQFITIELRSKREHRFFNLPLYFSQYRHFSDKQEEYCFNVFLANGFGPLIGTGVFCGQTEEYAKDNN
jgi:hypothetical protein